MPNQTRCLECHWLQGGLHSFRWSLIAAQGDFLTNSDGKCKRRCSRTSRSKHRITSKSQRKDPVNVSEFIAKTIQATIDQIDTSMPSTSMEQIDGANQSVGKQKYEIECKSNPVVDGSSSMENGEGAGDEPREVEELGSYLWLDSEINRLMYILECEVVEDPRRGNETEKEEASNEVMGQEKAGFDGEWIDWIWTGSIHKEFGATLCSAYANATRFSLQLARSSI